MGEKRPETMKRINTPELANAFIEEQVAAIKAQVGQDCLRFRAELIHL